MGNLLNIRGLRLEAGSRAQPSVIIKGLDLELDRGEVLGLVGQSGAGKSSAGLAAMGYVRDGVRFAGGAFRQGVCFAGASVSPEARFAL